MLMEGPRWYLLQSLEKNFLGPKFAAFRKVLCYWAKKITQLGNEVADVHCDDPKEVYVEGYGSGGSN